jgi:NADPH2:quinone reductase
MQAIGYLESHPIDHPEALLDIELERPVPTGHDLLVAVRAISVNPVDTKMRMRAAGENGRHRILGWDAVGEVIAVGDDVTAYRVGDRVWYAGDLTRPGSNAEFQLVEEHLVGRAPGSLKDAEAAALPLTSITAWELLFDRLKLPRKDTPGADESRRLLVVGAAGGVGSILVQLARQLTDVTVIGTASRPESQAWVTELGAHHVIDHRQPLHEELKRIGIADATQVISLTHTEDHFDALVECLAPQGQLALIDDPETLLDIRKLKRKSVSLHWEFMFTRSMFRTADRGKQRALLDEVASLIDAGTVRTTLGAHYGSINAENLRRAHRDIEQGRSIGKVVLEGFG